LIIARQFIERQFIERQFVAQQFIEFFKTKYQKLFKCTHATSLSNFIKPNNSVSNAHTQLFYRIFLTQYHQLFKSPIE